MVIFVQRQPFSFVWPATIKSSPRTTQSSRLTVLRVSRYRWKQPSRHGAGQSKRASPYGVETELVRHKALYSPVPSISFWACPRHWCSIKSQFELAAESKMPIALLRSMGRKRSLLQLQPQYYPSRFPALPYLLPGIKTAACTTLISNLNDICRISTAIVSRPALPSILSRKDPSITIAIQFL